jgi:hypothetical protein
VPDYAVYKGFPFARLIVADAPQPPSAQHNATVGAAL